tara:strand:+ start:2851 stop:3372 length:522 start_codon:yes stop_codon:yes gene_type:complete
MLFGFPNLFNFCIWFLLLYNFTFLKFLSSKEIGKFSDWAAYAEGEGKNLACMAVSKPKKAKGNYKKRGDVFAVITHLPGQDKWNEFSIVAGYNYKPESNPDVVIGDYKVQLFTSGSRAWSFSPSDDEKIIKSLKSSMRMTVVGTSSRGTITTDTYSLVGFTKAYQKITEVCKK